MSSFYGQTQTDLNYNSAWKKVRTSSPSLALRPNIVIKQTNSSNAADFSIQLHNTKTLNSLSRSLIHFTFKMTMTLNFNTFTHT